MRRLVPALLFVSALACGGLFVDAGGLEHVRQAVVVTAPEDRAPLFVAGAAEAGLVWFGCAKGLAAWPTIDPSQRSTLLAALFSDATAMCPSTCGGGSALIEELGPLSPRDRIGRTIARCDAEGPDPAFGGPLAALRSAMPPLEYLVVRELLTRAVAEDRRWAEAADDLAVSLALAGAGELAPTDVVATAGSFSPPPGTFLALADRLRACDAPHLRHRIVVAPGGGVAAVSRPPGGACAADLLATVTFPTAVGWAWVDVTYTVPPAEVPADPAVR